MSALATSPRRVRKRNSRAKLNRERILAAWTLYEAGYSIAELTEQMWRKYGYASPDSCMGALRLAFRLEGKTLRSRREVSRLHYSDPANLARLQRWTRAHWHGYRCSSCGCASDASTVGCRTCLERHRNRRKRAVAA